ncbi:uncharacterized protein PV09_09001 [Verruconis gallopava]|uniref:Uncharacterized protein n=1 Tax=Verruconis gallopava TaxID=253628 RepID=A0A0D2AK48_9PEZI|nr:uncharacterized protein PV09_09001 [Verruconis gallopava]KIV99343.1 hypothetical protein PV09_09001 [Verruconis gallopava]
MSRHGRHSGRHFLEGLGVGAISIGGAAAAIGATYKFSEFLVKCKRLFEVRSENEVFVRLVESVQADLAELDRLLALKEVKEALRHNKGKTLWIQTKVRDVNQAIGSMKKYTRKVANAGWWLGIRTRIWWVLHEYEKLMHREMELASAREGVLAAIEYLSQFEKNPEKAKAESTQRQATTTTKKIDVDVDVERRREGTRVIELDYEGRPKRDQREYEYFEEEVELERPRRRNFAREGFYDGRLDGPLSTRPSWWTQKYGEPRDEYVERRVVEEKIETDMPLRVHWPSSKL